MARAAETPSGPKIEAGRSRDCPVAATFIARTRLNKHGSQKETWHLDIDLAGTGLDYRVGDAFGVFPTNDPALADAVIKALAAPADFPIGGSRPRGGITGRVLASAATAR